MRRFASIDMMRGAVIRIMVTIHVIMGGYDLDRVTVGDLHVQDHGEGQVLKEVDHVADGRSRYFTANGVILPYPLSRFVGIVNPSYARIYRPHSIQSTNHWAHRVAWIPWSRFPEAGHNRD
ncbi:MAG: hypothetical protein R6V01_00070 [Thermoplasmatota archaeon]